MKTSSFWRWILNAHEFKIQNMGPLRLLVGLCFVCLGIGPAVGQGEPQSLFIEVTGYQQYSDLKAVRNQIEKGLPEGAVFYEKNLRKGWVRFLLTLPAEGPLKKEEVLAQIRDVQLPGYRLFFKVQEDQSLKIELQWMEKKS